MRVITLGSGQRGAGKSFLAVQLGLALARQGLNTCLVDLDFHCGDLHLLLGIPCRPGGVLEFLRGRALSLEDMMVSGGPDNRLFLIPGVGETLRPTGLAISEISSLCRGIAALPADVAIVDLSSGVEPQVLDLFLAGDLQVVVVTQEPEGLADAARLLRRACLRRATHAQGGSRREQAKPRVYTSLDDLVRDMNSLRDDDANGKGGPVFRPSLVVNRCRPPATGKGAEIARALRAETPGRLDLPVLAEIPEDPVIERSMQEFQPLPPLAPLSAAGRAVTDLANYLAQEIAPAQPVPFPGGSLDLVGA